MLKRALSAIAIACMFASMAAHAAGTIPYSLSQQFDRNGNLLIGCRLYIIQAGTTSTPQNAYYDTALTLPTANPMTCDGAGRLPQFFLADGQIKIRLDDANSVNQVTADNILVVGPSSGGGGGGSVDPTTVLMTGDFKHVYNTGTLSGFVRCNGRTIGNATSGATERANTDTSALFSFLYTADTNLSVSGGRGASAAADYAANKTITLPDCRGRGLFALDDMGNSAAGRLTATYFGVAATTLGAVGGSESKAVLQANFPSVNFTVTDPGHVHIERGDGGGGVANQIVLGIGNASNSATTNTTSSATTGISVASGGSGTPLAVASPGILVTTYIKL